MKIMQEYLSSHYYSKSHSFPQPVQEDYRKQTRKCNYGNTSLCRLHDCQSRQSQVKYEASIDHIESMYAFEFIKVLGISHILCISNQQ